MLNGPKHLWNRDDTIVYTTSHVPCGWGLGQYFSCHINLGLVLFFWRIFCCGLETESRPQISLQWNKNASIFNWYFWQKAGSHAVWRRPQESQCFFTIKSHNFLGPPPPCLSPFAYLPCSSGQSSISSPATGCLCDPGQSLAILCFPVSKTETPLPSGRFRKTNAMQGREAAGSCGTGGGPINTWSRPTLSPPSSPSLDMLLPPPAH